MASTSLAPAIRLMRDPAGTYRALAARHGSVGAATLLRRPLLVALVLGVVASLAATGRLTVGLVLSGALCWGFVPFVQLAALAVVLARTKRPPLPFARVADLFFEGHAPWSLWMLTVASAAAIGFPGGTAAWPPAARALLLGSAVVPMAWTAVIVRAFFREVVGLSAARAARTTAFYEALVWSVAVAYFSLVTQLWARLRGIV